MTLNASILSFMRRGTPQFVYSKVAAELALFGRLLTVTSLNRVLVHSSISWSLSPPLPNVISKGVACKLNRDNDSKDYVHRPCGFGMESKRYEELSSPGRKFE